MSKNLKKAITVSAIILIIIIAIISTFFIVRHFKNKEKIDNIMEVYSDENVQDRIDMDFTNMDDLMQQVDGEYVIGVIEINKIGFRGLVYKGTSLDTLSKGVGHFESSPYLNGNVCLAAHNTSQYWAKLHTL